MHRLFHRFLAGAGLALVAALGPVALAANAQLPPPPSTIFGSVTDAAGDVPGGLTVEAYIGETLCATGETGLTGEGEAEVTYYFVEVLADGDGAGRKPGCGVEGARVRIKVGDRFAEGGPLWTPGPVRFDITFGDTEPRPIPTFTPTATTAAPTEATPTPPPTDDGEDDGRTTAASDTPTAVETIPAGSPGAGSPVPTLEGGLTSTTPAAAATTAGGDGGFPLWGVVALVLGGIAVVGGGVGYAMSRNAAPDEDATPYDDDSHDV